MPLVTSRQYPLVATADVSVTTAPTTYIDLPPNAKVTDVDAHVVTGAGGTTPTLTLVDNAGSPNTYLSAVAIGVAGTNHAGAAAEVGNFYPTGARLSFSVGGTTPTGGRVLVSVTYVVVGRTNEVFGTEG